MEIIASAPAKAIFSEEYFEFHGKPIIVIAINKMTYQKIIIYNNYTRIFFHLIKILISLCSLKMEFCKLYKVILKKQKKDCTRLETLQKASINAIIAKK